MLAMVSNSYANEANEAKQDLGHQKMSHSEAHLLANANNGIVISQPDIGSSLFILTARRILKEAYSRIGKQAEFEIFPAERSIHLANTGDTDGELARITGLKNSYPNLIEIPISIATSKIFAYSKKHNFTVNGWQSLKPYKIDFIFGFKSAEQNSKGLNTSNVKTRFQGLNKLKEERSDVFVGLLSIQCVINKNNFSGIKQLTPVLDNLKMYHYLHKRNKPIAEKLKTALLQMQETGEIALIQKQVEQEFLDQCEQRTES